MRTVRWIAVRMFIFVCLLVIGQTAHAEEKLTVAAAADLKFALDEVVSLFGKTHPDMQVTTIYGSSGSFDTQIRQGAPYDMYFSADIAYPRALYNEGYAASPVQPYALGRIVLWSTTQPISTLSDLADARFQRIAIANPQHAPYGQRAAEALKAAGVWDKVAAKLVYGENVAQTAQFVQSDNAQAGIIALSLALSPELSKQGRYVLIPEALHQPLEQGFIITHRAAQNRSAHEFARFMGSPEVRTLMARYGFTLPGERTDERK
jgi:molybdate transport system substrate-binding protein